MTRDELADRFAAGRATGAHVAAYLGRKIPVVYQRIDGPPVKTTTWNGLCIWVYEHVTGRSLVPPAGGTPGYVEQYYGRRAADAVRLHGLPQPEAAPIPPEPPPPEPPPPAAAPKFRRPPERPRGALAAAIVDVVPGSIVVGSDWRAWPAEVRDAVGLRVGVLAAKIVPAAWDRAAAAAAVYFRGLADVYADED